ncbi:hypothetical protein DY000_02001913 [Brassica cretica]|uniref:Uncharacterized protein n=1 Tax=Brassica cretica TaxID=69181 RepID=A0ABQ7C732_BRACR|nr:hypothetical protein DY000_02001913 [Brassica cretica]
MLRRSVLLTAAGSGPGNRWSGFGSGVLWLGGRFARWWARRLLCGSGEMVKPVPEPLKVSGQARAYVIPVSLCLVSGEVLVWRVGLSGAICQVEDLLTVWHSCWGIAGAFADVFSGLSSTLAPLLLTVASEISILGWVVVSTGYMHGHVQVLLFRVWILSSIVEFSGSAFKVMAFSTWFWVCLEMFVALAFFFNGEASRVLVLLIYPDWRHVLVSFGCPFEISGSLRCSSMYKITDHPFLIRFISLSIIDEVITGAPEINLQ